jgi:hypothetical protein
MAAGVTFEWGGRAVDEARDGVLSGRPKRRLDRLLQ